MAARKALTGIKVDLTREHLTKESVVSLLVATGVYSLDSKTLKAPSRTSIGRWTKDALKIVASQGIAADRAYTEVTTTTAKEKPAAPSPAGK